MPWAWRYSLKFTVTTGNSWKSHVRWDWVYDFALPPLILHTLFTQNARALGQWLSTRPQNCITVLDTHDGIGVIDIGAGSNGEPGLLAPSDIDYLVETLHARSKDQ